MTYQQSVFKRYHSDKHFSEFLPTRWRQKSAGTDMEQNYVTVTLSILRMTYFVSSDVKPYSATQQLCSVHLLPCLALYSTRLLLARESRQYLVRQVGVRGGLPQRDSVAPDVRLGVELVRREALRRVPLDWPSLVTGRRRLHTQNRSSHRPQTPPPLLLQPGTFLLSAPEK